MLYIHHSDFLLPVGISFYTFQCIGYIIDVYRKDIKPIRNIITYALFVSFFPQLVAGPNRKSQNLQPQFHTQHTLEGYSFIDGLKMVIWVIYPENGFIPMNKPAIIPQLHHIQEYEEPFKTKLECIERIIQKCKARNIDIVICFPPTLSFFEQGVTPCVNAVKDLCNRYDAPCLIDYNNEYFYNHPELFYDTGHVNKIGANKYSMILANHLHHILIEKQ